MDAMPVMIVPLKCNAPASVAMVTLCGMAASALVNATPNGVPAGPVSESGENRKSRASIERMTGAGVGRSVGGGVGFSVGWAVRVGDGDGAGVGLRVGADVCVAVGLDADAAGDRVVAGAVDALGAGVVAGPLVGAAGARLTATVVDDGVGATDGTGESGGAAVGTEPPQAARNRTTAASRRIRVTGTAAL
jgi:hypothetical protein